MAERKATTITIPFDFPNGDYPMALAQFVKRVDYGTVERFAAKNVWYSGRTETDVIWSALRAVQHQLAEAGFNPR